MSGFDHDLREKILGFNAHLKVFANNRPLANYAPVMNLVASNKNVRGVAPFVLGQVLVVTQPPKGQSKLTGAPWVRGVDPARESSVSVLPQSLISGKFDLSGRGLVVGSQFAENLNLSVGDRISIYSPADLEKMEKQHGKPDAEAVLPDDYTVTGIFDVGYYEYNANIVVTSLENAQDLYNLDDNVHGLMVMLNDPYQAPQVRRELLAALGPGYNISTWTEENSGILSALVVEKNVMLILLLCIVAVAALCILGAQITFVIRKTREIGMLKALGSTNLQIFGIFLFQSAIVGVIGVTSGFGLGIVAITYRNEFLHFLRNTTGWELFPASIYGFGDLPAIVSPHDIAIICGSSFFICIAGGVLPAIWAGLLKPVEALRYE
jgi:lipoprotein-releasing system permease protein